MNTFAVVFLCVQACLVQTVFCQCYGGTGYGARVVPTAATAPALGCGGARSALTVALAGAAPAALGYGAAGAAAYGGAGEGNVAVAGELPVTGNTAVIGAVPILGAVSFAGDLPASGCVSINGQCSCGCGY